MPTSDKKKRNPVGLPHLYDNHGRLCVRVTYQSVTYYVSIGLPHEKKYFKVAQPIKNAIETDIILSNFDTSLERYRALTPKGLKPKPSEKPLSLSELWAQYTEFKSSSLEKTTLLTRFTNVSNWLSKLPSQKIDDAVKIRDYLVANTSTHQAKSVLTQINCACNWGVKSGKLANNPFKGLPSEIKHKKSENKKEIDPFSRDEMNAIINVFWESEQHSHYASFVEFMFLTGCRPSEAVGLRWRDISADCSRINFSTAIVQMGSSGEKIEKGLKTQERRTFPCGSRLQRLLECLRLEIKDPNNFVFGNPKTTPLSVNDFNNQHWKGRAKNGTYTDGVVTRLVSEGTVERYRTLYNTRHTFITLSIQSGVDVATVASWVGNSPQTIYKHYCGTNRESVSPNLS